MEHRTTVVEFSIEPANLFAIAEDWASKFRFSLYERSANHAIYSKSIRLMKAWLTIENNGEHARMEAWMSGPGVGPDFSGNAWRGWKTALPHTRFGFGPQFIFRKQFFTLLDLLKSKTQSAFEEISPPQVSDSQPVSNRSTLAKGIAFLGVMILIVAAINLFTAIPLLLKSAFPHLRNTMLMSGVFEITVGALLIASARALAKGKIVAGWLYGASILIDGIYNTMAGRPMNYLFIGFGLLSIWQMFKLKDEWKLS